MTKKLIPIEDAESQPSREKSLIEIKQMLKHLYPCFVLLTCSAATKDGKMEVEMDFEGDEDLAALMTENAVQVFEDRVPRAKIK